MPYHLATPASPLIVLIFETLDKSRRIPFCPAFFKYFKRQGGLLVLFFTNT